MKKKKKHQQGISVPIWLQLIIKNLERISPYWAMRVAAHIFSKPLKFKMPQHEEKALIHCTQKKLFVPNIQEEIHVYEWKNTGEKVLLAHGWSGRGTQLYRIAEMLHKQGFSVIAYDAPAHGKSTGTYANILKMIAAIDELNHAYHGFDHVIGHSLGAMALLNYYKNPQNVKKIIVIGAGDVMSMIFENFTSAIGLSSKAAEEMTAYFEHKYEIKIDDYSSNVVVKDQHVPTLILHDEDDFDILSSNADNIAKHHPNATLIKTKGLGHRKILRDDAVINHIISFILES